MTTKKHVEEILVDLPSGEFHDIEHPVGRIYSSGKYWHTR